MQITTSLQLQHLHCVEVHLIFHIDYILTKKIGSDLWDHYNTWWEGVIKEFFKNELDSD